MMDILYIVVKLSAIVILPTLFVAALYKKIDVLSILTAAMFIGLLSMFSIVILDTLKYL